VKQNQRQGPFQSLPGGNDFTTRVLPEGSVNLFGQGHIWHMAYSPDGKCLAVATSIGLWWYELATMSPVDLWNTEQGIISTISFSANGKWIATGGVDGSVKVWDISSRVCIAQVKRWKQQNQLWHQNEISCITFSPDHQQVAVSGKRDYIVDLWHPETGERLGEINGDSQIELRQYCGLTRPIAFSPDSQLLACLSPHVTNNSTVPEAEFISVWNISSGDRVATLIKYPPGSMGYSVCFSPCGSYLIASGNAENELQIWDARSWQQIRTLPDYGANWIIPSYSSKGVLHVAEVFNDTNTTTVWDVEHAQKLWTCQTPREISDVLFFNGTQLAVNSGLEFKAWTVKNNQTRTIYHTHLSLVNSLAFSSDGKTLGCGYSRDGVLLWNVDIPSNPPSVFKPPGIKHHVCAFSNRKFYTTCIDENTIKVWEVGGKTPFAQITPENPPTYWAFAFDPVTKRLASGDDEGTVRVWDVTRGLLHYTFTKHTTTMVRLAFSPDGKFLASFANYGPEVRLWDVAHGQEISNFPRDRIETLAFSPCGTLIAADTEKEILVWDSISSETLLTIPKPEEWIDNGLWQLAFAFSPDGRYLASGSCCDLGMVKIPVRLWEMATGENLATFWGHTRNISAISFSPDGTLLASGSDDGTILLWDMKPYL